MGGNESVPLHIAAMNGPICIVEEWLRGENDPDFKRGQWALLHYAAFGNNVETMKMLLNYDAKTEVQDNNKWTPLHIAARYNCANAVQTLLDYTANTEAKDRKGRNPLQLASKFGHVDVMRILLKAGAEPDGLC